MIRGPIRYLCSSSRWIGAENLNGRNLTGNETNPTWSPDGKWLAFSSNEGNDIDIYKICVDCPGKSQPIRLTDEPRAAGSPQWTPDGAWLVYLERQDLMVAKADRSYVAFLASPVFGSPVFLPE